MDNENNSVDINSDDLDAFEDLFFNRTEEHPHEEDAVEDDPEEGADEDEELEEDETEDDHLATEDDEDASEDEDEDGSEEEEEEEPQPRQKKNRKSAKERIEELVTEARVAQREAVALRAQLAEFEAQKNEVKKEEEPKPLREQLPAEAPHPDAVRDDGEPLYPLGEFDPSYIRDITKFTIEEEMRATKERQDQEQRQREAEAAREAIRTTWNENLEKAEEELPDIRERIQGLTETFSGVEPNYGEYLASTIMSCEYGPQIMYYLSQNIGEAQKIVASGPAAATLAIGRLEAKFINSTEQTSKSNKKVSTKAAPPPPERTRGSRGQFSTRPDTDDLDAFEREFYKKG